MLKFAKDDVPTMEVQVEVATVADIPTAERDNCYVEAPEKAYHIQIGDIVELLADPEVRKKLIAIKEDQERDFYIESLKDLIKEIDTTINYAPTPQAAGFLIDIVSFLEDLLEIKQKEMELK